MIETFAQLSELAPFLTAIEAKQSLVLEQLWDVPKAILATLIRQRFNRHVVIVTGGLRENRLFDDFPFLSRDPVLEFPAWETLPSEEVAPSPDIVGERYHVLRQLVSSDDPLILLAPLQALLQQLLPPQVLKAGFRTIRVGDELPFSSFLTLLTELGFQRRAVVADKGEFAVRGGIIDLFPVGAPDPYRLEFWGDEIESIRRFDPVGQKSVGTATELQLTPAAEYELLRDQTEVVSLLDYLGSEVVVIFDDLAALEDRYVSLRSIPGAISKTFVSFEALFERVGPLQKLYWTAQPLTELSEVDQLDKGSYYAANRPPQRVQFSACDQTIEACHWHHPFTRLNEAFLQGEEGDLVTAFSKAIDQKWDLHFVCANAPEQDHLKRLLTEVALPPSTTYHRGYLSSGFQIDSLAVVPMTELTHRYQVRRQKHRSTFHTPPSEFLELKQGDLVVHLHHGIGRYLGTERHPNYEGREAEFLSIEYADHGKMYVPLTQAHLVSPYIGTKEEVPQLHTLGGGRWQRTRLATERAIRDYAADLLKLQASRQAAGGHAMGGDGELLTAFEATFPYEETEDQLLAIADVKTDMRSEHSMDRLVCGDVGYGKTEVAMRAAFKSVVDGGKQVALLVPTTILAMQHYESFCERMDDFPLSVGVVSRFRTPKQVRETLEGVRNGTVDILIGTHRLLSKDVAFKDLGLVVIDEEHRFGVRSKEKIRAFKAGVDCLALSATPIPRTLYLSLLGARHLSVINTPPQDRLPIKTILTPFDEQKIQVALLRELARDGQVYIIHNRVETIYRFADRIRELLPQARIGIAHGQMHADEIDTVFHAFKQGQVDILVATTIIESGVDIPNANTILIDRADRYGLADLYQLRGRVGRWDRRAYCYFLTPKNRTLSTIAHERLSALLHVGGYGGGMKVAMRDLQIRGAGNILGTEQSGHVSAVGFHLYCKLLKRAIDGLKGEIPHALTEVKLEFPQDARLPESYIGEASLRMEFYQRLGEAITEAEVDATFEEMQDRFGRPPLEVEWLYRLMRVRALAARQQITGLTLKKFTLTITKKKQKRTVVIKPAKTPKQLEEQLRKALLQGEKSGIGNRARREGDSS